jgi:hypothetical protein
MRPLPNRAASRILLAAGLALLAGCSRGPTFAEVNGTLTAGGKPLENVQVEFWPTVTGPRSLGVTDKEGHFTLTSDNGKHPGAVVGAHKVVLVDLTAYAKIPVNMPRAVESLDLKPTRFGITYADPNRTPLKADVNASGPNAIELRAGP